MTETLETAMTTDLMLDDDILSEFELDTDVDIEFDDTVLLDWDWAIAIECDYPVGTAANVGAEDGDPWEPGFAYIVAIAQAPSDAELPLVPDSA